jgi:hypothetical protein
MEVTIRVKTEKPVSVATYLEEVLKQMKQNKHFAITEYEVKKE